MTIAEILTYLDQKGIHYSYSGDPKTTFSDYCPLNNIKPNSITWVRHSEDANIEKMNRIEGLVLFTELGVEFHNANFPIIQVDNVHRSYFRVISHFFQAKDPEQHEPMIASTAVIETDRIGKNVYIGHHTYIGPEVTIGDNVIILHNVTMEGKVIIGNYTTIESGTTIGACGFGHYWNEEKNPVAVPHLGGVVIGQHVKIGANNAISRGCLSDTIIEDYVKTDNLCHIAHNDHIKHGAMLTANSVISGSTVIGRNAWLAPGSLLNNAIEVGDNAFLGIGAVATKNVPAGKIVVGMPAKVLRDREEK